MRTTIDSYKTRAGRLDLEGIDFDDFRDQPLSSDALRSLRYMHDVEHHTVCYLRDLLLTPAHQDPAITSFLSCWVFEEMWHGEAIGQVLEAHGEAAGAPRIAALRQGRRRHQAASTLSTIASAAFAGPGLHRLAHDVGRHQRVDDPGRLLPTRRGGRPPDAARAPAPHHEAGGRAHRLLRVRGDAPTRRQPQGAEDDGARRIGGAGRLGVMPERESGSSSTTSGRTPRRMSRDAAGSDDRRAVAASSGSLPASTDSHLPAVASQPVDGKRGRRARVPAESTAPGPGDTASAASTPTPVADVSTASASPARAAAADTRSSGWWASSGSPGPKLAAGTPCSQNDATSVQPTLALGAATALLDQRLEQRMVEGRRRAVAGVEQLPGVARLRLERRVEELVQEGLRPRLRSPVRRVAVVQRDPGLVGDDVARHSPVDGHHLELLGVGAAVEHDLASGPVGHPLEQRGQAVDGVAAR